MPQLWVPSVAGGAGIPSQQSPAPWCLAFKEQKKTFTVQWKQSICGYTFPLFQKEISYMKELLPTRHRGFVWLPMRDVPVHLGFSGQEENPYS